MRPSCTKGTGSGRRVVLLQSRKGAKQAVDSGQPWVLSYNCSMHTEVSSTKLEGWATTDDKGQIWSTWRCKLWSRDCCTASTKALIPSASASSSVKWAFTYFPNDRMTVWKVSVKEESCCFAVTQQGKDIKVLDYLDSKEPNNYVAKQKF